MANIPMSKGKTFFRYGNPMTSIQLIVKGRVSVNYPGGHFVLGTGDVVGINEICSEIHFLEYVTLEDCELAVYPVHSMEALEDFFTNQPDIARLCLVSAFKQIATLMNESSLNSITCNDFYTSAKEDYSIYKELCEKNNKAVTKLDSYDRLEAYLGDEAPDYWLNSFYTGLCKLYSGTNATTFLSDSGVTMGMLRKCSLDFRRTFIGVEEQDRYTTHARNFYLNAQKDDFLQCITELYSALPASSPDCDTLFHLANRIFLQFQEFEADSELAKARQEEFTALVTELDLKASMEALQPEASVSTSSKPAAKLVDEDLQDSMSTILAFADADEEYSMRFRKQIYQYRGLADKYAVDEESLALRNALTQDFYLLYHSIFFKTVKCEPEEIPTAVKLFLYFGYIDEAMAGIENTRSLKELLPSVEGLKGSKIYPMYHWLLAIYNGEKETSRNEFEVDYMEQIRKMKADYNLSLSEFRQMENDQKAKVEFEMKNMFPSTNKMTFGRISAFMPFFDKDNVLKALPNSLVTQSKVDVAIATIKSVDYTVFYRETMDADPLMGKLPVHKEYNPDIILTPNSGIRAVMWQEIEGKLRTSPARFALSIFHQEDFPTSFIRLAGEFRWEMCKRIQGSRWNDVTDPSLTSEYFDYIQFYRKSHDLSSEAKEKVKSSLQRCKNSFKEMFVRDYMAWVLYEGNGSIRLNKVARRILFTYCPFPSNIISTLTNNPQYTELLSKHKIRYGQQLHLLNNLSIKIQNANREIPDSLIEEIAFYNRGNID